MRTRAMLAVTALVLAACAPDPPTPAETPRPPAPAAPAPAAPLPEPPAARGRTGRITGTVVRGEADVPEPGMNVTLVRAGSPPRTAATDGWGRFVFDDVATGVAHEVRVETYGCETVVIPVTRLTDGESRDVASLTLGGAQKLRVRVVDENGRGIPGADVEAYREPAGDLAEYLERAQCAEPAAPTNRAQTDEDGIGVVPLAPGAVWTVAAHAKGRARVAEPRVWRSYGEDLRVTLQLPPESKLAGRVTDDAGRPAPGAIVAARRRVPMVGWCGTCDPPADSSALWTRAVADAQGRYELASLPPGVIEIVAGATRDSMCGIDAVRVPQLAEFDVTLLPTASIAGRAVDADTGAPVEGVVVAAKAGFVAETARIGVTDADGRYRLDGVATGTEAGFACVAASGWQGFRGAESLRGETVLVPGQILTHDLKFRRAATVTGRALRGATPVAHAHVEVIVLPAEIRGWVPCCVSATTDAAGRFRIEGLYPGASVAYAAAPDADASKVRDRFFDAVVNDAARRKSDAFDLAPGAVLERDVDVLPALPPDPKRPSMDEMEREMFKDTTRVRVHGSVIAADGFGPQRPNVEAEPGPVSEHRWRMFPSPTEPNGTYSEEVRLPHDDNRVTVYASDDLHDPASATVEVPEGANEVAVDVALKPLPVLRGRVTDEDQRPCAGAIVRCDGVVIACTSADGSFEVRTNTGKHAIGVDAAGCVGRTMKDVAVPQAERVDVELRAAADIEGAVVGADGRPAAGVRVVAVDDDAEESERVAMQSSRLDEPLTGPDGKFRVRHLSRGESFRLRVESPKGAADAVATVTTAPIVSGTRDVRIETRPARRISGLVTGPKDAAIRNVTVTCRPGAGGIEKASVRSGDDGSFAFEGLDDREYELEFAAPAATDLGVLRRKFRASADAQIVTLAPAPCIEGVLVDFDGKPIAEDEIEAVCIDERDPTGGNNWRELTRPTGADGRFRIPIRSGTRFRLSLGRFSKLRDKAEVTGGESVSVGAKDVRIVAETRRTLGGVVVAPDGTPIARAEILLRIRGNESTLRTDDAGAFSVSPIAKCVVPIRVRATGRVPVQMWGVDSGKSDLRIVLQPGLTVTGRLLDADGAPASRFSVRAYSAAFPGADLWHAAMGADGAFTLGELSEGEWFVEAYVEKHGEMTERVSLGTVKAGARDVELHLPK